MAKFPVLYKYTSNGQAQQWQIFVNGASFYTVEGIVDGKLTTSLPTVCKPKNVGRANETSAEQQAMLEAAANHQKKLDKGYNEKLTAEKKFFEPMLAKDAKESKDLDFKKRTFVQPKLDGLRAISENNTLASRNGKPYVACPHLYQSFHMPPQYGDGQVILDGELYSHEYHDDFNKIVSLCKKAKPTAEELAESAKKVQHWVYDMPSMKGTFSHRYAALRGLFDNKGFSPYIGKLVLVPTHEVHNWDGIKEWHERFLSQGYEGTIIRIDMGDYENKRSKQLLKYKDFVDEEFTIVGAVEGEGNRAGTIGKFIMDLGDGSGKTFGSNVKGDFEYLKELWKHHKKYIGKEATVKYFNRTPDNVPRFPYVIKIDRTGHE